MRFISVIQTNILTTKISVSQCFKVIKINIKLNLYFIIFKILNLLSTKSCRQPFCRER